MKARLGLVLVLLLSAAQPLHGAITGNPSADGWTYHGNSLALGTYVRGDANYSYDTYTTTFIVDAALQAASGNVWNIGDTIIGAGGVFTGSNPLLDHSNGPKIQAKFGTGDSPLNNAPWSASPDLVTAGVGTLGGGGIGSIQVRSSAYLTSSDWTTNAGALVASTASSPIARYLGSVPSSDVARLSWTVQSGELATWQILLNTSQIPGGFNWNGQALMTVQDGDNAYTDALLASAPAVVPEPASLVVWSLLAMTAGGIGWWRRRSS